MTTDISSSLQTGDYTLRGRFWIESPHGTFLGNGRVILLERILEYGSISAAARSMKMSYRQAWQLVQAMNEHATKPLVTSSTGGKGGGGAALTNSGKQAIRLFRELENEFHAYLQECSTTIQARL